jgi:hypothetical protein
VTSSSSHPSTVADWDQAYIFELHRTILAFDWRLQGLFPYMDYTCAVKRVGHQTILLLHFLGAVELAAGHDKVGNSARDHSLFGRRDNYVRKYLKVKNGLTMQVFCYY